MDLPPRPSQVLRAAGNVGYRVRHGGMADLRPMPRELLDDGSARNVHHYLPDDRVCDHGDPVLLVPPLAAPSSCFDLRRGCSLVEHLVSQGRPTYVLEHDEVTLSDASLGLEQWVDEVVPLAVRTVSAHSGGHPAHVVGWSLGGIFAVTALAAGPDLPVASLTLAGTPIDLAHVPLVAPPRSLLDSGTTRQSGVTMRALVSVSGAAIPLWRWASDVVPFQSLVTTPLAIAQHLDDAEFLAQVEAVGRFTNDMTSYRGRRYGQIFHRMLGPHDATTGIFGLGERTIDLGAISVPVLVLAGATDSIAPMAAVRPLVSLLGGAPDVRFEIVPGGHLGLLAGRGARDTSWPTLSAWLDEWSGPQGLAIGTNRTRRHRSSSSRDLRR